MNPFRYQRASTIEEAILATNAGGGAKYLGGGTNLVDLMKGGVERPRRLSISPIST